MLALQNYSRKLTTEHIDKIIDTVLAHPDKNDILKQTNNNGSDPLMFALENYSRKLTPTQINKIIDAVLAHPDKNNILKQISFPGCDSLMVALIKSIKAH